MSLRATFSQDDVRTGGRPLACRRSFWRFSASSRGTRPRSNEPERAAVSVPAAVALARQAGSPAPQAPAAADRAAEDRGSGGGSGGGADPAAGADRVVAVDPVATAAAMAVEMAAGTAVETAAAMAVATVAGTAAAMAMAMAGETAAATGVEMAAGMGVETAGGTAAGVEAMFSPRHYFDVPVRPTERRPAGCFVDAEILR